MLRARKVSREVLADHVEVILLVADQGGHAGDLGDQSLLARHLFLKGGHIFLARFDHLGQLRQLRLLDRLPAHGQ